MTTTAPPSAAPAANPATTIMQEEERARAMATQQIKVWNARRQEMEARAKAFTEAKGQQVMESFATTSDALAANFEEKVRERNLFADATRQQQQQVMSARQQDAESRAKAFAEAKAQMMGFAQENVAGKKAAATERLHAAERELQDLFENGGGAPKASAVAKLRSEINTLRQHAGPHYYTEEGDTSAAAAASAVILEKRWSEKAPEPWNFAIPTFAFAFAFAEAHAEQQLMSSRQQDAEARAQAFAEAKAKQTRDAQARAKAFAEAKAQQQQMMRDTTTTEFRANASHHHDQLQKYTTMTSQEEQVAAEIAAKLQEKTKQMADMEARARDQRQEQEQEARARAFAEAKAAQLSATAFTEEVEEEQVQQQEEARQNFAAFGLVGSVVDSIIAEKNARLEAQEKAEAEAKVVETARAQQRRMDLRMKSLKMALKAEQLAAEVKMIANSARNNCLAMESFDEEAAEAESDAVWATAINKAKAEARQRAEAEVTVNAAWNDELRREFEQYKRSEARMQAKARAHAFTKALVDNGLASSGLDVIPHEDGSFRIAVRHDDRHLQDNVRDYDWSM
ncbi:hypothetical protein NFJ02_02g72920 [Pycnococcus provasolii]